LQRAGRLVEDKAKESGGWRLVVQQAAVDVLLTRVPWDFRVSKLPWMQGTIQVDW
jgi:Contractile injection system tape measure protein